MALGESVNLLIPLFNLATLNKPFSAFYLLLLYCLIGLLKTGVSEPCFLGLQDPALILTTTVPSDLKL